MRHELVPIDEVIVLDCVQRPLSKVPDDRDTMSVKASGIQQPLVMIEHEGQKYLAKGLRRLRIARHLELPRVPAVILPLPDGREIEEYVREIRLVLQVHRQDLAPSQKAGIVDTLKEKFGMTHKEVAAYLGIAPDSVTNWLAFRQYIEPVKRALDAGKLTMQAARVFDGMTDKGQRAVWTSHAKELTDSPGGKIHKRLRHEYPPTDYPEFYRDPELITQRLARKSGKRKGATRTTITTQEKRRLETSLEVKERELKDTREDHDALKREINAAIVPIGAILRNEKLRQLVPVEMLPELVRWGEIYC